MKGVVLLLDDEENILRDVGHYLATRDYDVHTASSIEEAKKIILSEKINYAIIDLRIENKEGTNYKTEFEGIQIVNFVKKIQPRAKVIVLSAYPLDDDINSKFEVEIDGYMAKGGPGNYILSLLGKIAEFERMHGIKTCFVIMPISDSKSCREAEWTEIFNNVIKPAVEGAGYNYQCKRSEALFGNIIENILDELNRADIVIADLTDRNPNVFYELGVRHALRGATILIAQSLNDIPFDLRPYATQVYDWKITAGRDRFKERIKEIIQLIESQPAKASSPVREYLQLD